MLHCLNCDQSFIFQLTHSSPNWSLLPRKLSSSSYTIFYVFILHSLTFLLPQISNTELDSLSFPLLYMSPYLQGLTEKPSVRIFLNKNYTTVIMILTWILLDFKYVDSALFYTIFCICIYVELILLVLHICRCYLAFHLNQNLFC